MSETRGQWLAVPIHPPVRAKRAPEPQLMWKPLIVCTSPRSTVSVAGEGLIGCHVVCAGEETRSVSRRSGSGGDKSAAYRIGAIDRRERKLSRNDGRVFDAELGVVRHDSLALSNVALDQRARDHSGRNGQSSADSERAVESITTISTRASRE